MIHFNDNSNVKTLVIHLNTNKYEVLLNKRTHYFNLFKKILSFGEFELIIQSMICVIIKKKIQCIINLYINPKKIITQ